MSDNKGYITLWNVNQVRQCISDYELENDNKPNVNQNGAILRPANVNCNNGILDQWSDGHSGSPVRSVSLTQEGCYLASAGDDGRVLLWILQKRGMRQIEESKVLARYSGVKLNTVDAESREELILVASDARKFRVNLYRENRMDINADCYE